jgi:response regulator RpfG family c-di-GMP phosphodiesterase
MSGFFISEIFFEWVKKMKFVPIKKTDEREQTMEKEFDEKFIEQLIRENKFLKAKLKREHELAEQANMELVRMNIESETQAQELKQLNLKLQKGFLETIRIIENIIELKNPGYKKHAKRVAEGCVFLGKKLDLSKEELLTLEVTGRIHEIGKLGIPEHVTRKKPTELTKEEIVLIHSHPVMGESVFEGLKEFEHVAKNIRHMRENVDGSGLPDHLVGEEIPLGARILAIAETFDTLYQRKGQHVPAEKLYEALLKKADVCFDARLVELYEDFVLTKYSGKTLEDRKSVLLEDLQEGMKISKSIRTLSNIMLVPKGTVLTTEIINKIKKYAEHEAITHIEVYK